MPVVEPRIWLGIAVAALMASVVPYWYWIGPWGVVLSAGLAFVAAATLVANVRGEHRLMLERIREQSGHTEDDENQRRTIDGAPSATNGSGTSTEPSSRW